MNMAAVALSPHLPADEYRLELESDRSYCELKFALGAGKPAPHFCHSPPLADTHRAQSFSSKSNPKKRCYVRGAGLGCTPASRSNGWQGGCERLEPLASGCDSTRTVWPSMELSLVVPMRQKRSDRPTGIPEGKASMAGHALLRGALPAARSLPQGIPLRVGDPKGE